MTGPMDTLGDGMRELHAAGWIEQLSVHEGGLRCDGCRCWAAAEDVNVDEVYRFEGTSDPGDESILFAISMPCGHRGTLPAAYGKDTEPDVADVVTRLPVGSRSKRPPMHQLGDQAGPSSTTHADW